jgi:hypothetical protein
MNESSTNTSTLWWWIAVTGAALLTLVLGPPGFWEYLARKGEQPTVPDVIYRTMQLFLLGCDLTGAVPLGLQVARFLGAFVAFSTVALALMQLFRDRIEALRLRFYRNHLIVCGLGPMGTDLIESLRQRGERVVIVEPDANHEGVQACRDAGLIVVIGSATDSDTLRRVGLDRARALLTLFQDDVSNLCTALLARQMNASRGGGSLKCVVQVSQRHLRNLLLEQDFFGRAADPFRLELFNHHEIGAQALLEHAPVLPAANESQGVLLVGLGSLGETLLLRMARGWLVDGSGKRRVIVVDSAAERHAARLRDAHPFLDTVCDLSFHQLNVLDPAFARGDFLRDAKGKRIGMDAAFVCLSDESVALLGGARLAALLAEKRVPIVLGLHSQRDLGDLFLGKGAGELRIVSLRESLLDPEHVLEATREALAQVIHEKYLHDELAHGAKVADRPSLVPWQTLPATFKESSRDQAAHIPVKLRSINCRLVPARDQVSQFAFAEGEIEKLAPMEHERWCAERTRNGWQYGPTRDDEGRLHPSLVPWDQLTEVDKDRDRNPVRNIPNLVAKAGYAIVRDTAAP